MPQEVEIWGVKNLKRVEKMNHDTGEREIVKRCTGTIEFPVLANEAGIYEDKKVYIYTEEEHNTKKIENPHEAIKTLAEYMKTILLTLKDMDEEINRLDEKLHEEEIKEVEPFK